MTRTKYSAFFLTIAICLLLPYYAPLGQSSSTFSTTISSAGTIGYPNSSPSPGPTATPTPTPSPTQTPTPTPSPSPKPSPTPTPTMTPTPSPTPSPTPTPTPTPTTQPSGINLAPINDGHWHSDSSWNVAPADNFYYDTTTTHNGALTFRAQTGPSLAVDHEWNMLAVKPGDHIVITVWVKTSGTPDSVPGRSGATVGIDMYTGNYGGSWARIGCCNSPGFVSIQGNYGNGYPSDTATWMVPWGTNWTLRTYDFYMPSQWWGDGAMPTNNVPRGVYVPVQYICPWLQISANYGSTQGTYTTWFSDFQLHVNP